MAKQNVLQLDRGALLSLLNNAAVIDNFPQIRQIKQRLQQAKPKPCKCGNRKKTAAVPQQAIEAGLRTIANMPPARQQLLKKMLKADVVRIRYNKVVGKKPIAVVTRF